MCLSAAAPDADAAMDAPPAGGAGPPGGGPSYPARGQEGSAGSAVTPGRPHDRVDGSIDGSVAAAGVAPGTPDHGLDGAGDAVTAGRGPSSPSSAVPTGGPHHRFDGVVNLGGGALAHRSPGPPVVTADGHGVRAVLLQGSSVHVRDTQSPAGAVARAHEDRHDGEKVNTYIARSSGPQKVPKNPMEKRREIFKKFYWTTPWGPRRPSSLPRRARCAA